MPTSQHTLNHLRDQLEHRFSLDELKSLCADINIDFDDLPNGAKSAKVRELVSYCNRRDMMPQLITACKKARPNVNWGATLITVNQTVFLDANQVNKRKKFIFAISIIIIIGLLTYFMLTLNQKSVLVPPSTPRALIASVNPLTPDIPSPTSPINLSVVASLTAELKVIPSTVVATTPVISETINSLPTLASTITPTTTPLQRTFQHICTAEIETDLDAVQSRSAPNSDVFRLIDPGTIVVIINKLETAQSGKWYLINDENGNFLGWVQAVYLSSLSPDCPKY